MNRKTTKTAAGVNTTKAVPAAGRKRSETVGAVGGARNEPAARTASTGRKRRKPFVL